jgi:Recombination endonuclease VII
MEKSCSLEGCQNKHYSKGMCQNHYRQARREARGLKKPGPQRTREWSRTKKLSTDTHCANGHPWNDHTEHVDEKSGKRLCRYCGYLAVAQKHETREARDLESWMKWREDREQFCKRGHLREGNTRVDPKTGNRICRICQVDNRRRKNYGLEPEDYRALWAKQDNECIGCLVDLDTLDPFDIHIDHDHATGAVRGILCHHCNLILGHAKDDPAVLRRLADYIDG